MHHDQANLTPFSVDYCDSQKAHDLWSVHQVLFFQQVSMVVRPQHVMHAYRTLSPVKLHP